MSKADYRLAAVLKAIWPRPQNRSKQRSSKSNLPSVADGATLPLMSKLLSLAVLLLIVWVIFRVALAVTSVALHLIWVAAVVLALFWLVGKLRGTR